MTKLVWDADGERYFNTGCDQGVLYPYANGAYLKGVAWNGLISVSDTPSGAEAKPQYADNLKYLELRSPEEKGLTIEAFQSPPEFDVCDGTAEVSTGVYIAQQEREKFGFSWRSRKGNDTLNENYGYYIHIAYGCSATPSERAYSTINESPEAATFSWEVQTTKVPITGRRPSSYVKIDSTKAPAAKLAELEDALYGAAVGATGGVLPTLSEVLAIFDITP